MPDKAKFITVQGRKIPLGGFGDPKTVISDRERGAKSYFDGDRDLAWKLYVKRTSGDADAYEAAKKQAMKNLTPSQYDRVDDLMDGFERQHREDMGNMRGYREDE